MKKHKQFSYRVFIIKNVAILTCITMIFFCVSLVRGDSFFTSSEILKDRKVFGSQDSRFAEVDAELEYHFQPETDININTEVQEVEHVDFSDIDLSLLNDVGYQKSKLYIVDSRTDIRQGDINAEQLMNMDLKIDTKKDGPKILIFHTHSSEGYIDSDMSTLEGGIVGIGDELENILESRYGIEVLHHKGRYDVDQNGNSKITGAYERMEPDIRKILEENPSIEMVIDLHRDGVREDVRLVENINGKDCAKLMFFNGLCKIVKDGTLQQTPGLSNPYIDENLALSMQMQLAAEKMYPILTRKIYLNAYRYSLHMCPKSMLIEVGAQTNTYEEAKNSMSYLADVLASVIL